MEGWRQVPGYAELDIDIEAAEAGLIADVYVTARQARARRLARKGEKEEEPPSGGPIIVAPERRSHARFLLGVRYCTCHLVDEALGSLPLLARSLIRTHGEALHRHPEEPLFTTTRGHVEKIARQAALAVRHGTAYRRRPTVPSVWPGREQPNDAELNARYSCCRTARAVAITLVERLQPVEIDVSEFDLTRASITSPEWLEGVIWDDSTLWTEPTRAKVLGWSREIGAGRWQVVHRWPRSLP